ncbi:MAG: DUF547 domain-containing protein, partial [Candidatus Anammoxibacter sp.]
FSRYLRGVRPNAIDVEISVIKSHILLQGLGSGEDRVMAYFLNEHEYGLRSFGSIETDNTVKEISGFYSRIKYNIGGIEFSADDIEHGILRANAVPPGSLTKQFKSSDIKNNFRMKKVDSRIHFALVCGARSCAPIKFYFPGGITEELELATKNFINSSEVFVIPKEKRVIISMIFKWYKEDFGGRDGVLDLIARYLLDRDKKEFIRREKTNIKISYLHYDWKLNT